MIKKIAIIGAGGVGSNLAFAILSKINPAQLVLLDIDLARAQAVACDLGDTRGIFAFSTQIKATKSYAQIKGSDIVIFSAGVARRQGMTRLDLLRVNAGIAKKAAAAIKKYCPQSLVLVITNPLDIITYLILKETKFSRQRVMGMGSSLDTSRLLNILFEKTKISVKAHSAVVFGPHSKEMLVNIERKNYWGKKNDDKEIKKISKEVQMRGAKIVRLFKNKSAVFGPAAAGLQLIEAIAFDKNEIIPVSVLLKGEYGLKNVCLGMPCLINKKGAAKVIEKKIKPGQKKELKKIGSLMQESLKSL